MNITPRLSIHSGFGLGGSILLSHDQSTKGRVGKGDWEFWISLTIWKVFVAIDINW
jgi:hypothetical protein